MSVEVERLPAKRAMQVIPLLLLMLATLSGCGMTRASQRPPAPVAVVKPTPPETLAPKDGSIWQSTDRNTLFLDNKARNVGDIITVQIFENSSATQSADTNLNRNNKMTVGMTGMLDFQTLLKGGTKTDLSNASMGNKQDFEGAADTSRMSTLTASISCVVTEVMPNGNLRIEGRRDITVNFENQFILLSGMVRPEDISPDNTIRSTQIADARIDYSGDGDMNDQQRPNWINRFFSTINII